MGVRAWVWCLSGLAVLAGSAGADAQYSPLQSAQMFSKLRTANRTPALGFLPGAYEARLYRGTTDRLARLQALSPYPQVGEALLKPEQPSLSPISNVLDRHNFLRPRSLFGRRLAQRVGQLNTPLPPAEPAATSVGEAPFVPGQTYEDRVAKSLKDRADEDFELALSYFRESSAPGQDGLLIEARNHISSVLIIDPDAPRGYIVDVFIAYNSKAYNRAFFSLMQALKLAKTLDDLKIDGFVEKMYKGDDVEAKRREFRRTVESVSLLLASSPESKEANVLLAYFAWLNGDLGTAVTAAEAAAKVENPTNGPYVARFRDWLAAAKAGSAPTPAPGS